MEIYVIVYLSIRPFSLV